MTYKDLIDKIDIIKTRESDRNFIDSLKAELIQAANLEAFKIAVRQLQAGIQYYQERDDFETAIELINQSIKKFPTADAYYNKGVIYQTEGNELECFNAQSASILLDKENIPKAYLYRAVSLYGLYTYSQPTNTKDAQIILDFVLSDFKKARNLGEESASSMITDIQSEIAALSFPSESP